MLRQVGTDLAGVTSIRAYYSARPFRIDPDDGAVVIRLPEPFHDLLVVDLTQYLLRKTATIAAEVRGVAMQSLKVEEDELLVNFLEDVRAYTSASEKGRFGRTVGSTKQ